MSERVYQQKMLNSKSKVVMCNWKRGSGKTHAMVKKILTMEGNVLILTKGSNDDYAKIIHTTLMEMKKEDENIEKSIKRIFIRKYAITIEVDDRLINIVISNVSNTDHVRGLYFGYLIFDNYYPSEVEIYDTRYYKSSVKQVFIFGTFDDLEYISDKPDSDSTSISNMSNFIETQIKELMLEFSGMPKRENTVKTRNDILKQVAELVNIKSRMGV